MNDITKKVLGGISIALLAGVAGAGISTINSNAQIDNVVTTANEQIDALNTQLFEQVGVNQELTANIEFLSNMPIIVPEVVETIVEVPVETLVDNGNLDLVLDHIYDNDGSVQYLTEDLDDDEVNLIVNRIVFINDIKSLAVIEAENEIKDLLDKEEFTFGNETITFDEDDVERVRVQSDGEDLIIDDVDFEDGDADVLVQVKFEQDDVKYLADCTVQFRDGVVDDIDLDDVELRD